MYILEKLHCGKIHVVIPLVARREGEMRAVKALLVS